MRWRERKEGIRVEYPDNPRHRSLVQALVMSYEEIKENRICRRLWELLTLFPSSVPQRTLIAVLSEPNGSDSAFDVEDALDSLAALSIVRWEIAGVGMADGDTECNMLSPLRQVLGLLPQSADEKLRLQHDRDDVISLLKTYYLSYLHDDKVLLRGEDEQSKFILKNINNILYYLNVLATESSMDYVPVLELLHSRVYNYYSASPYNAINVLSHIVAIDGISLSFSASLHKHLGDLAVRIDDLDGAEGHYVEAEGLYGSVGDGLGLANVILAWGDLATRRTGRDYNAETYYIIAANLYRSMGDGLGLANALRARGDLMQNKREYAAAIDIYTQALELYGVAKDSIGPGYTLSETIYCHAVRFKECGKEDSVRSALALIEVANKVLDILPYESVKEYMLRKINYARNLLGVRKD